MRENKPCPSCVIRIIAIEYGYRWYGKNTPEEEKDILFDFLSKHTDRLYKYSEAQDVRDAVDPREGCRLYRLGSETGCESGLSMAEPIGPASK